jgi:hypothetical protein
MSLGEHSPPARCSRPEREAQRVRHAATAAAVAGNASVLAGALAQIGAAFDETAAICAFKIRAERMIRLGPHHPAARARFGARAEMLAGYDLAAATALVERGWRDERKAFQIASALGCGTRLSLDVLSELRLILRWMRSKHMHAEYESAIAVLCGEPLAVADE